MNYKELFIDKDDILLIRKELVRVLGDLNEAVILNQLHYWIEINRKADKNFYDDRYWVFNTYQTWRKTDFDFWSTDTIRRTLTRLENKGIVSTANYNKLKIDKTKWYTIDYEKLQKLIDEYEKKQNASKETADCVHDMANCTDGNGNISKAIPENTSENINKDYHAENTVKYTLEDVKKPSSKGNIYTSAPEKHKDTPPKKQSRYIPKAYTEEQLVEHIRPTIEENLKVVMDDCDVEYNPDMTDTLVEVIRDFYSQYCDKTGHRHRILSDSSLVNVMYKFFDPPEELFATPYDVDMYAALTEEYLSVEFDMEYTTSISHFMGKQMRAILYHRTK